MRQINPEELTDVGVATDGFYTVQQFATMLNSTPSTICYWLRDGIVPSFDQAGLHGKRGHKVIPCLQIFYLMERSSFPVSESLRISAANYLFLYGREPDRTKRLAYRAQFDQQVDGDETISQLEQINRTNRNGYAYKEEDPEYQQALAAGHASIYMAKAAAKTITIKAIPIFDTPVEQSDLDPEALSFAVDLTPQQTVYKAQPVREAAAVPVRDDGILHCIDIANSLGISQAAVSAMTKRRKVYAFPLAGEKRRLGISGLDYYIFCKRGRLSVHQSIIDAAVRSVATYGFSQPIPAGAIPPLGELVEAAKKFGVKGFSPVPVFDEV